MVFYAWLQDGVGLPVPLEKCCVIAGAFRTARIQRHTDSIVERRFDHQV
jgi:hypothetical protein